MRDLALQATELQVNRGCQLAPNMSAEQGDPETIAFMPMENLKDLCRGALGAWRLVGLLVEVLR